jgi:hypothetical protein
VFLATNITHEDGFTPIICPDGSAMMTEGHLNGEGSVMAVSGSTSFSLNAGQIIDKAFHRLGKASEGEAVSARMYEDGLSSLNLILKSKLGTSDRLSLRTEGSLDLVANQEGYTLTNPFPARILSIRRRSSDDIDVPLRS